MADVAHVGGSAYASQPSEGSTSSPRLTSHHVRQDELSRWLYEAFLAALKSRDGTPSPDRPFTETLRGVANRVAGELAERYSVSAREA